LATAAVDTTEPVTTLPTAPAPWHVLWTHSHCEQMVCDQLAGKGFRPFLPKMEIWSVRAGHRRLVSVPLFNGYLFVNHDLDKVAHTEIIKVRGVVRILGEGWDRPAVVPAPEIEAIRQLVDSGLPMLAHPYLREGRRVRIISGPLADLEGILLKSQPKRGVLVLSVNLLQRSVAVEIDCTRVAPAD
jgi:transcription antitermination factor NusG